MPLKKLFCFFKIYTGQPAAKAARRRRNDNMKKTVIAGLYLVLFSSVCGAVPPTPLETIHFFGGKSEAEISAKVYEIIQGENLSRQERQRQAAENLLAALKNPDMQNDKRFAKFIRRAVTAGADVNARDAQGNKALDLALLTGNADVVKFLVSKGATLRHGACNYDNFLLALAEKRACTGPQSGQPTGKVFASDVELAKFFRSRGARPDMMALASAVHAKNTALAEYYLSWFGPEVHQGNGRTALHQLALWNDEEGMKFLTEKGADPAVKDAWGKTAADYLAGDAASAPLDVKPAAQEPADPADIAQPQAVQTPNEAYPLHGAARRGDLARVKALVADGADVNQVLDQADLRTPLMEAARFKRADVVVFLLENGADVNLRSEQGYTALHWAILQGNRAVVKLLVDKGRAKLNVPDARGDTALHLAVKYDRSGVADYLKKMGARTDIKNKAGQTAAQLEREKQPQWSLSYPTF